MPCCIIAEIIWFYIRKFFRKTSLTSLIVLFIFTLGVIFVKIDILNFAMINRAMLMQLFVLAGYLYRENEEKILRISWIAIFALFFVYIAMGFVSLKIWPTDRIDVHMNQYYNWPYCFAMMLLGCFMVFIFADKLNKTPYVLRFIGQNTLVYYLLNTYGIKAGVRVLSLVKISIPKSIGGACIKTLIACITCAVAAIVINNFLPEIVGKKRKRTTS